MHVHNIVEWSRWYSFAQALNPCLNLPFLPFVLFEPRQAMSFPSGPQFHRLEVPYDADLTASKNLNVFFGKPTIANTCVYDGCYGTIRQGQIDRKVVQQNRRPPLLRNTHCISASYASPAQ